MTEQIDDRASLDWTKDQLLLTTVEAATVLHVGRTTVYELINEGALHPIHIGRACRISRAELERYVAELDERSTPAKARTHQPTSITTLRGSQHGGSRPPDAA
jgi:excisionase family DNA binding protein